MEKCREEIMEWCLVVLFIICYFLYGQIAALENKVKYLEDFEIYQLHKEIDELKKKIDRLTE